MIICNYLIMIICNYLILIIFDLFDHYLTFFNYLTYLTLFKFVEPFFLEGIAP